MLNVSDDKKVIQKWKYFWKIFWNIFLDLRGYFWSFLLPTIQPRSDVANFLWQILALKITPWLVFGNGVCSRTDLKLACPILASLRVELQSENIHLIEKGQFWLNILIIGREPWWLWEETHVLKVMGSNPCTIHWMDIFSNIFILKIGMFVRKTKYTKKGAGYGPLKHIDNAATTFLI